MTNKKESFVFLFVVILILWITSSSPFAQTTKNSSKTTTKTTQKAKTATQSKKATSPQKTSTAKTSATTKKGTTKTKPTDSSKQKQDAEKERGEIRKQITSLKKEIKTTETAKGKAENTLAQSEAAIKQTNSSILDLEKKQTSTEEKLGQLTAEQGRLETTISKQKEQLAQLLEEQYISSNEDRMKLLFSGDNPNRINRELQFMAYISEEQTKLTEELKSNLTAVDTKRTQTENVKDELAKISHEKQVQKQKLEKEKAEHQVLLKQLDQKLQKQKKEAEQLEQNEKQLTALVNALAKKIAEQRKAAEAARLKARQKSGKRQKIEAVADAESAKSAFAKQKGRMKLPVKGTITAQYGEKRSDGPSWKGIFIQSPLGTDIRCVANGEVVFSNSLRGFGNMIIVDHGAQYMTIYANAQSLRRKVGDNVKGGDVIATIGNSSDNSQTGLYFEMRHNGQAFNPMGWVVTR